MVELREGYVGEKYSLRIGEIINPGNSWNCLEVEVFKSEDLGNEERIFSYNRNYHSFYSTFFPFRSEDRNLALYSPEYMYTRLVDLDTGEDLGGESKDNVGYKDHFCPVEYYVPFYRRVKFDKESEYYLTGEDCFNIDEEEIGEERFGKIEYCDFGFVAGCFWSDDSSWKIQYLDLSRAEEGIISRTEKFGYIELPSRMSLRMQ